MGISINNVKQKLMSISHMDSEEINSYEVLVENAVNSVETMCKLLDDSRAELLSAAKANYDISLAKNGMAAITSFKAGDVSISQKSNDNLTSAKALLDSVMSDCSDMINDSAFDFRCV